MFPTIIFSQNNWGKLLNGFNSTGARCFYEDTLNDRLLIGNDSFGVDTIENSKGIIVWNGNSWDTMGTTIYYSGSIFSIVNYLDTIYVAGNFDGIGGNPNIRNIAKWNGNNWIDINFNIDGFAVHNMRVLNNELYLIGAADDSINGINSNGLLKYNGSQWSNVYDLPNFSEDVSDPNILNDIAYYKGELYIGGNFNNSDLTIWI